MRHEMNIFLGRTLSAIRGLQGATRTVLLKQILSLFPQWATTILGKILDKILSPFPLLKFCWAHTLNRQCKLASKQLSYVVD